MVSIFIPGIGKEESIVFSPQIFMKNNKMENKQDYVILIGDY